MKVIVIDRDGTLLKEPEDFQVDSFDKLELVKDSVSCLLKLKSMGFDFLLVSNQDYLGTEKFPFKDFLGPHNLMLQIFESQGITFKEKLICPHGPDECSCRKPKTGLFSPKHFKNVDFDRSFVVGDRDSDIELAKNLGFKGIKIDQDLGWKPVLKEIKKSLCCVEVSRETKETRIHLTLIDNQEGVYKGNSLPFLDHMLEQLAKHSGLSLELKAQGDLEIDQHHLVEDIAITLGKAIRRLFDTGAGLKRFGFLLPMDESLCQMAIDIGRPFAAIDFKWSDQSVGEIKTSLIDHFFRSFAHTAQLTLNLKVTGKDNHHMCESSFKALGKCLGQAFSQSGQEDVLSTKGLL